MLLRVTDIRRSLHENSSPYDKLQYIQDAFIASTVKTGKVGGRICTTESCTDACSASSSESLMGS
jgi:hypothetical protein